jgi:hypothetical protein
MVVLQWVAETTSSVLQSGNKKRKNSAPSRRLVRDAFGVLLEAPVGVLNGAYPARATRAARGRRGGRGGREGRGGRGGRGVVAAEAIIEKRVCRVIIRVEVNICVPCAPPTFVLGELIVNVNKLRGVIPKCNDDGTYDVRYNSKRTDSSVATRLLKTYVAPPAGK